MKEATDRMIGVIDADSTVISCSDTSRIGEKWPEAVIKLNSAPDSIVVVDKTTFKPLVSWSAYFDYAVFAEGDDEIARSLCVMAYVALNGAKTYYEEKHDKGTFVKNIITDNILPGDIYIRAKELHFVTDAPRAVFLVRQVGRAVLFAAFLVVSASGLRAGEPSDIHTLLRRLDGLLDRREEFLLRHEARLDSLKSLLCGDTLGFGARYAVTAEIAERYFAYQSDSTIAYLRRNVALAERAGNADLTIRAKSVMAMCYSMNGRFLEADRVLAGATDTLHMSRATQAAYYAAQHRQNRECRSQSEPGAERDRFRACEEYYARRALETTGDISKRFYFAYLVAVDEGDYDRAAAACDSALACAPPASHDYARAAFYRSETERFRGDEAARFEWLVRAAMADVQGAVRDYGALGGVAEELLRRGDAARAMRCIRVAINDTQAYNSPIRSWRDMAILPQIEQAYSERNARLRAMYVALILLAFLFALSAIGGVLFVLRQNRRLNAVQQTLRESNGKLAELAASLRETNADLSRQNIRIADANRIKEVYIGGFLKTISEYIYKLADTYRHVGRMLRDGRSDELRREYAGTDVRSDELKEFYHNFDTTFLGLFPSFIGEFNRLLADDARIGVRRPGSLTTELRIFALVRLGITDTATIAALLHCSVNTVYSYRSRMRLRSLVPERDFEQRVQSIGLGDDAAELSGT